jgi:hypothetical protein
MNNLKLRAAIKKYGEQFVTDPESAKESIMLDYEKDEVDTIIESLENSKINVTLADPSILMDKEIKGYEKEEKECAYKWFDEFDARIQKKEVRNPYTQRNESIITGWALEKKKHPKKIEPSLAISLNSFADGYDVLGVGNLLVPKDQFKSGDLISYESWAKDQGKDEKQDINILLSKI